MRVRLTVEDDEAGGRTEWSISRELDVTQAAELDDTIMGKLIKPTLQAFDDAARLAGVPESKWEEE